MFSYLNTIQPLVDETIFNRGQRLYLEGRVSRPRDLVLDYWREYTVDDTKDQFRVRIPLLHLALSRSKFTQAGEALAESVSCECEYFRDFGLCKHLVAVCSHLEQEFGLGMKSKKQSLYNSVADQVLDSIFTAERDKLVREFQTHLEDYLNSSGRSSFQWVQDFAQTFNQQPEEYLEFFENITDYLKENIKTYEKEKRILKLLEYVAVYNSIPWWNLIAELIVEMHPKSRLELTLNLWPIYSSGVMSNYQKEFEHYLNSLSQEEKDHILEGLIKSRQTDQEYWLKFIFVSQNILWIQENYEYLDPENLIKAATFIPDQQEELTIILAKKMRIWSEFLPVGEYEEIISIIDSWQKNLGRGDIFEDTIKYIIEVNKKRRGLVKKIREIL